MPSVYDIKPAFQSLLRPAVRFLAQRGITPNQVTITATILSIITGWVVYQYHSNVKVFFVLPIFLFVRMALNAIDGMLAREHDMTTSFGAFLNELGDVVSDTALYLPFAVIDHFNAILVIFIVLLACISEMAGVVAVQIGASRRYEGPMGKSDRAFAFGLIGILLGVGIENAFLYQIVLWIILVALILTIANRIRKALEEVK